MHEIDDFMLIIKVIFILEFLKVVSLPYCLHCVLLYLIVYLHTQVDDNTDSSVSNGRMKIFYFILNILF